MGRGVLLCCLSVLRCIWTPQEPAIMTRYVLQDLTSLDIQHLRIVAVIAFTALFHKNINSII